MAADEILIVVKGKDEVSGALKGANDELDTLEKKAGKDGGGGGGMGVAGALGGLGMAAAAGAAVAVAAIGTIGAALMDISGQADTARTYLGDIGTADLQDVLSDATLLSSRYGTDLQETMGATKALMDEFGITSDEATSMLIAGFDKGMNTSGDFLDSIGEYSNQFAESGASAEEFFSFMESGQASGVLGTDKAADAFKEFGIRMREMGDDLVGPDGSLRALMGDELMNAMADGMANGTVSVADAYNQIVPMLAGIADPIERNAIGVQLFGTQWEDLGASAILGTSMTTSSMADLNAAAETSRGTFTSFGEIGPRLWGEFATALLPAADAMLDLANIAAPALFAIVGKISGVVTGLVTGFVGFIEGLKGGGAGAGILTGILTTLQPIADKLGEWVQNVATWFQTKMLPALKDAATVYAQTLQPRVQALVDVLTEYLVPIIEDVAGWLGETLPQVISILVPIMAGFATISIGGITTAFRLLGEMWNNILKPAFAAIGQWLKDLTGGWGNLKRGADAFLKILSDIGKMISNLKVPSWVTSGAQAAGSWLGGLLPGHASGVRNFAGGWSVVGERGPELVNLPRGSDVLSNRASSRMLARASEGGATITIAPVFSGVVIDNEERLRQVSTQIRHETERAMARAFGTAVDSLILGRGPL